MLFGVGVALFRHKPKGTCSRRFCQTFMHQSHSVIWKVGKQIPTLTTNTIDLKFLLIQSGHSSVVNVRNGWRSDDGLSKLRLNSLQEGHLWKN